MKKSKEWYRVMREHYRYRGGFEEILFYFFLISTLSFNSDRRIVDTRVIDISGYVHGKHLVRCQSQAGTFDGSILVFQLWRVSQVKIGRLRESVDCLHLRLPSDRKGSW
jgi:hypothetical protein